MTRTVEAKSLSLGLERLGKTCAVVGSVAVTLFGLCAITFVIGRLLPLDPVLAVLGDDASQEAREIMAERMGLNRPLWEQFIVFMGDMVRFDFGRSITTGEYVATDLKRVMGATIELSTLALLIAAVLGIPLGVFAAVKRRRWQDHLVRVFTLVGYSAPTFWLGLMGFLSSMLSLAGLPDLGVSMCSISMTLSRSPGSTCSTRP